MPVRESGDPPGHVAMRLNPIYLAGFYERGLDDPVLHPGLVTGKDLVLTTDGNGPDGAFDCVVVLLNRSVG
jgi:hypothetical protein